MKPVKMFSLVSVLVILSLALANCSPAQPTVATAPKPDKLTVWIQWGDNPQQIQTLFDKFGTENGLKVEVTAPLEDTKIVPALTGSEPPDVLVLSGGDNVKSYAKENLVNELSNAISVGKIDVNDIFPATIGQCMQDGKYYCLPWGTDLYALLWNKDLFEAAGLDPEKPPKTMEELVTLADKLTKVAADGTISQIGFVPDLPWSHTDLYVRQFGGWWYSADGKTLLANSQPMLDAFNWEKQFYTKYNPKNVEAFKSGFGEYSSPDNPFYAGKVAMIVEGEWQTGANFIKHYKPELNYGVAPFPPLAAHPERANTAVAQGTVVVIPKGAKNPDWSAKLIAWMLSPDILAEEMYANANLPTSKKAAQDPRFQDNNKFKVFLDLMSSSNNSPVITTPITVEFNDAMGQAEGQVLQNGADAKTVLDKLQADFESKLK